MTRLSQRVCVVDAQTEGHLLAIGQAIVRSDRAWLPVGSAGLAGGLAPALELPTSGGDYPRLPSADGPLLVVAGSRSDVTTTQVLNAISRLNLGVVEPDVQRLVDASDSTRLGEVARVADDACRLLGEARTLA